jgi:hypothetical protein
LDAAAAVADDMPRVVAAVAGRTKATDVATLGQRMHRRDRTGWIFMGTLLLLGAGADFVVFVVVAAAAVVAVVLCNKANANVPGGVRRWIERRLRASMYE